MTFLEKLDLLMEEQGINRHKLSQISKVPYTTIVGFYSKGYENAKISTVRKLASALGCTLDYLIEDEPKNEEHPTETGGLRDDESKLLALYNGLNEEGQERLFRYAEDLNDTGKYIKNQAAVMDA